MKKSKRAMSYKAESSTKAGWIIIIHEIDYHISTIQLDAKSRKPLFNTSGWIRITYREAIKKIGRW